MAKSKIKKIINDNQLSLFDMAFNEPTEVQEVAEEVVEVNTPICNEQPLKEVQADIEVKSIEEEVKTNQEVSVDDISENSLEIELSEIDKQVIAKYSSISTRIIKFVSGRYGVDTTNGTIYLDTVGKEDYRNEIECPCLAIDQIIYYDSKVEHEMTDIQKSTLDSMINGSANYMAKKVIKRNGDKSIIILTENDKYVSITPKGWVLDFEGAAKYTESEVLDINLFKCIEQTEEVEEIPEISPVNERVSGIDIEEPIETKSSTKSVEEIESYSIGEEVMVEYGGEEYLATVHHIYNEGVSINCIFDNGTKYSTFHISKVRKI